MACWVCWVSCDGARTLKNPPEESFVLGTLVPVVDGLFVVDARWSFWFDGVNLGERKRVTFYIMLVDVEDEVKGDETVVKVLLGDHMLGDGE